MMSTADDLWQHGYSAGRTGHPAVVPRAIASQGSKAGKAWLDGWLVGDEHRQRLEADMDDHDQQEPSS